MDEEFVSYLINSYSGIESRLKLEMPKTGQKKFRQKNNRKKAKRKK